MRFPSSSPLASALLFGFSLAGCTAASTAPAPSANSPTTSVSTDVAAPATATSAAGIAAGNTTSAAARQAFAVERALGAECAARGSDFFQQGTVLIDGACTGRMPAYMAKAFVEIPNEALSREQRQAIAQDEVFLRAVPGRGVRADVMVELSKGWIRSFEGPNADTTVYLVPGPYCTWEDKPSSEACRSRSGLRAWRVTRGGVPVDVTLDVLPPDPAISSDDRARYGDEHGAEYPFWDTAKLQHAPALRLFMEVDPDRPLPDNAPNSFGGRGHFGFIAWNGTRFESRWKLPRSMWPCRPVAAGEAACSDVYWDKDDPFITTGE